MVILLKYLMTKETQFVKITTKKQAVVLWRIILWRVIKNGRIIIETRL